MKKIYELDEKIELGVIPKYMYALIIREERFGEPVKSMKMEKVEVPSDLDDYEILIKIKTAGVNHNVIWAGSGKPLNVIQNCKKIDKDDRDYFIPGSDGAGVVWKIGKRVKNYKIGDEVILQSAYLGKQKELIKTSKENIPNKRAWGYEVNGGTLAQFAKVQEYQCLPKPKTISWTEAGGCLVSAATSYRMLCHWNPNNIKKGDPVLIWGGACGIGSLAIQIANMKGAKPIAVVSTKEKADYCLSIGAVGVIQRNKFNLLSKMPDIKQEKQFKAWKDEVKQFRYAFFEALGKKQNPKIIFEHPGEKTIATSVAILDPEGMVVTCGGTSGYYGNFDLRQLWVYQKRIQGSHFASLEECKEVVKLLANKKIKPCIGKTYKFKDAIKAHQEMYENKHACGNTVIEIDV